LIPYLNPKPYTRQDSILIPYLNPKPYTRQDSILIPYLNPKPSTLHPSGFNIDSIPVWVESRQPPHLLCILGPPFAVDSELDVLVAGKRFQEGLGALGEGFPAVYLGVGDG
jgi:hypothetical protein